MMAAAAKRVRIYLNEGDHAGHQPAHIAIVELLLHEHAAGATVFRALEGFGSSRKIHTARLADIEPKLPVVVEWIDTSERVEQLLPRVRELMTSGLITTEEVSLENRRG